MTKNGRLTLVGGTLIDGSGRPPIENSIVIVKGNVIERVAQADASAPGPDEPVMDLRGKFILPGLIDSHVHIGTSGGGLADPEEFKPATLQANLRTFLRFGVTTIMDM